MSRALPDARMRFARLLEALRDDDRPGFALAELNDLLSGLTSGELCDAVELSPRGDFDPYVDLDHLKVFAARPAYLLAMKCAAMRLGEELHDLDDVRYLLRYLNITGVEEALEELLPG